MYKKNKLGIYVYDTITTKIDDVIWSVNSINDTQGFKYRIINSTTFGIELFIKRKYNVHKK